MFDFEPCNINMIKDKKESNVFCRILNTSQNNCCDYPSQKINYGVGVVCCYNEIFEIIERYIVVGIELAYTCCLVSYIWNRI